jgi:hypothetical protein
MVTNDEQVNLRPYLDMVYCGVAIALSRYYSLLKCQECNMQYLFSPRDDEVFRLYTKRICYAVDVIEIADNLCCVMNGAVI